MHQPQRKTRREVALEYYRRFHVQHGRAAHARLQYFDQLLAFHARARNQLQSFRQRLHLERENQIHRQLHRLSRAVRAQQKKSLPHRLKRRTHAFEHVLLAAHHENQLALFRAPSAACNRSVQKSHRFFHTRFGHAPRERRRNRARINQHRTAFESAEDRKSTRLNSSHPSISYAVFCLKKKKHNKQRRHPGMNNEKTALGERSRSIARDTLGPLSSIVRPCLVNSALVLDVDAYARLSLC